MNLTHLSLGIIALWQQLHVGNDIVDDMLNFSGNIIYTFLRNFNGLNPIFFSIHYGERSRIDTGAPSRGRCRCLRTVARGRCDRVHRSGPGCVERARSGLLAVARSRRVAAGGEPDRELRALVLLQLDPADRRSPAVRIASTGPGTKPEAVSLDAEGGERRLRQYGPRTHARTAAVTG